LPVLTFNDHLYTTIRLVATVAAQPKTKSLYPCLQTKP
jgi:hypothetical protein